MNYRNILLNKINLKKSTIGIIGLGYVGLPLAGVFAKKNFNVIGFDIDLYKIKMLKKNKSYISHIEDKLLQTIQKKFKATVNLNDIRKVDIIIICFRIKLQL